MEIATTADLLCLNRYRRDDDLRGRAMERAFCAAWLPVCLETTFAGAVWLNGGGPAGRKVVHVRSSGLTAFARLVLLRVAPSLSACNAQNMIASALVHAHLAVAGELLEPRSAMFPFCRTCLIDYFLLLASSTSPRLSVFGALERTLLDDTDNGSCKREGACLDEVLRTRQEVTASNEDITTGEPETVLGALAGAAERGAALLTLRDKLGVLLVACGSLAAIPPVKHVLVNREVIPMTVRVAAPPPKVIDSVASSVHPSTLSAPGTLPPPVATVVPRDIETAPIGPHAAPDPAGVPVPGAALMALPDSTLSGPAASPQAGLVLAGSAGAGMGDPVGSPQNPAGFLAGSSGTAAAVSGTAGQNTGLVGLSGGSGQGTGPASGSGGAVFGGQGGVGQGQSGPASLHVRTIPIGGTLWQTVLSQMGRRTTCTVSYDGGAYTIDKGSNTMTGKFESDDTAARRRTGLVLGNATGVCRE